MSGNNENNRNGTEPLQIIEEVRNGVMGAAAARYVDDLLDKGVSAKDAVTRLSNSPLGQGSKYLGRYIGAPVAALSGTVSIASAKNNEQLGAAIGGTALGIGGGIAAGAAAAILLTNPVGWGVLAAGFIVGAIFGFGGEKLGGAIGLRNGDAI